MADYPWIKSYPEGYSWEPKLEIKPLFDCFDRSLKAVPDQVFMHFMGRAFTYRQIGRRIERAAAGLQAMGVKKGTRVGLFLPNCPHYAVMYYAILKVGGIVVNFSPLYSERELAAQANDSGAEFMVTLDLAMFLPKMVHVMAESPVRKVIVGDLPSFLPAVKGILFRLLRRSALAPVPQSESYVTWDDLLNNDGQFEPATIKPEEDIAVLQYTGGTTGIPKGAQLTHANIHCNVQQLMVFDREFGPGSGVVFAALPFFHVFAMTVLLNGCAYKGWTMVVVPKFELEEALDAIAKYKVNVFAGVPTMYQAIINHPRIKDIDLSNLRTCLSGGAPMPLEVRKAFDKKVPEPVREGYGLTESSGVVSTNPPSTKAKVGSIGIPIPGTRIVIVDMEDPRKEMPLGEKGEIGIIGPQVLKAYWNKPAESEKSIINGMFLTGDIGYMDEDGYTFLVDRSKDLILVGGFNVFPRIIEEALYEHPAVQEVTVVGIPDDYRGETPKAFVVLRGEVTPAPSERELIDFLKDRIGKHEIPSAIEFRDELPKTPVGKLSKKELVAEEKAKYEQRKASA